MEFECKVPDKLFVLDNFFDTSIIHRMYTEISFEENFWSQVIMRLDVTTQHKNDALFLARRFVSNDDPFIGVIKNIDERIREIFGNQGMPLEIRGEPWMWNTGIGEYIPKHNDSELSDYANGQKNWKAIVFFNTFEEGWGGDTVFHLTEFKKIMVKPKTGRLVLFKVDTDHSVTCITRHALHQRIMLNYAYTSTNE